MSVILEERGTIWRAEWPDDTIDRIRIREVSPHLDANVHHFDCDLQLQRSLFFGQFVAVYFQGWVESPDYIRIGRFVRREKWTKCLTV